MDLVDIDRVLDNLELNEEEHQKENIPIRKQRQTLSADVDVPSQAQLSSASRLNKSQQSINYVDSVTHNNTKAVDRVNKFVGVSQVFSSLDDYRKNVETLDLYSNNKNNDNTNYNSLNIDDHTLLIRNDGNVDVDHDEKDEIKNENDDEDLGEDLDENDDDQYVGDEINKFVGADEYGFSSNSITTSSSSTFSSGPSPALISTESELDSSVNAKDEEIESLSLVRENNTNIESNENESTSNYCIDFIQPNEHDCSSNSDNNKVRTPQQPQQKQGSEFDDLAVGLSSISLSAHQDSNFSISAMASGSSKFILKTDSLTSSLSVSQTTQNYLNSDQKKIDQKINEADTTTSSELPNLESSESVEEENIGPKTQPQVMVTFSSTMDEISDTELDSILQEIDTEINSQHLASPEKHFSPVPSCNGSDCDEIINKIRKDSDNVKTNPSTSSCNSNLCDGMNVDSFSQASTLELTEDRADVEDDMNKQGEINVYDNDICDENESREKKDIQKRQRPTTLNLPVRKINLYATAGQTPPGSRIYDNTTSSSDDETPDDKLRALKNVDAQFKDGAGHTPPDRTDRAICFGSIIVSNVPTLEASNVDEPMIATENADTEIKIPSSVSDSLPEQINEQPILESTVNNETPFLNSISDDSNLGKIPPVWVPDQEANACMQCQHKFTLLKRRHHCRACGQVLCSVCCSQKFKLEFLSNLESRVCVQCFLILTKISQQKEHNDDLQMNSPNLQQMAQTTSSPNPNNPMEYCSKIPPHRQVNPELIASCPTVIVPVGVLKKEGNAAKSRKRKSVMFSDGIRPGSDLATLDGKWSDAKHARKSMPGNNLTSNNLAEYTSNENNKTITAGNCNTIVLMDDGNGCYIPTVGENTLPPIVIKKNSENVYQEVTNNSDLINRLQTESLKFVIQNNFFVFVKISHLKCCINKTVINFTTCGLNIVGNDEIIILLELDTSNMIPKDIFIHLNEIYWEASRGHPITELGFSMPKHLHFLGSREHGGFLFIRPTFQCLLDVHVPAPPFLIGVLIHRWEVPWAKIFPLRLMLRLGAHYRYYPSPHISVREREPVYGEIAQTVINLLADFRNYTYTIPTIKGMYIHMEDRRTNILIPRNRLDEVIKAINNSSDHILAMGANFSKKADGHLVCIQNIKLQNGDSHAYSTQAINIQGQPRKVTGASFFVFNEALKSTSGLSGKCSIIEDGLMVQILPSKMAEIRHSLTNMKDINIVCGPINADEQQSEVIHIQWVDDDVEINIGVRSPIDSKKMDGIPSIRVHSGISLSNNNHILKWTEVFIIEISGDNAIYKTTVDISKVSEQIARNASLALLPFLDLLVANGSVKIGLRVTLTNENVCYEAGSQNEKLPPLYMNALDNELIQTLHKQANEIGKTLVLELIFHILNVHNSV